MVYTSATLIFITSVITLYALILHRKNLILLIFLIPMLLTSTVYTGYSIYALQGTPINGIPVGKSVEILWVEPAKPWIRLMLRVEENAQPTYYKMAYTKKNMDELNKAAAKASKSGEGKIEGKFQLKAAGGEEQGGEFVFMTKPKSINPGKKDRENTDAQESLNLERETQSLEREERQRLGIDSGHATTPIRQPITSSWCDSEWGCGP
jgi:hypothetical protein